jgi:hypothetical protein
MLRPPVRLDQREGTLSGQQAAYLRLARTLEQRSVVSPPGMTMATAYLVEGPLGVDVLERCLAALRERHESLRTGYAGSPARQVVVRAQDLPPNLEHVDLSAHRGAQKVTAEETFQFEFLRRPFDLTSGNVMRCALVRLTPQSHRLVLAFHHIAIDGPSLAGFVYELHKLWRALAIEPLRPVEDVLGPAPELQPVDVAAYVARHATTAAGRADTEFWRGEIEGALALALPVDRPRDTIDARRDECSGFDTFPAQWAPPATLDASVVALAMDVARAERTTFYSLLVAAMAAHLHAQCKQNDIAVISQVHTGHLLGVTNALGLFANPLLLRLRVNGRMTYRQLVRTARDVVLDAFDHGIANVLALAPHQLFRLLLNYMVPETMTNRSLQITDTLVAVPAQLPDYEPRRMAYDLMLFLINCPDRLELRLLYLEQLFDEATASAFLAGYASHIQRLCRTPDAIIT